MRSTCAFLTLLSILAAQGALAQDAQRSGQTKATAFTQSGINSEVVKEFEAAWIRSGSGRSSRESLLLIFRNSYGSYKAVSAGMTNEYKKFTFTWDPNAIAIVHTHPNNSVPEPQESDRRLADRLGVPIMTITSSGMFMYDPTVKKTTKLQDGLDWLDQSKWARASVISSSR
jgi:hypothetical protein